MPKEWYEKNKITFINSMKTNWENAGKPQRVSYKDGEKVMTDQTLGETDKFFQFGGPQARRHRPKQTK